MALNIPKEFQYRYELVVRELDRPEDLERLGEQALFDLLMHPDEVVVVSPSQPLIELERIIDCYYVYDFGFQPVYQIANHRGFFGENALELVWLSALLPMTLFYVRYPTEEGDRTLMVLTKGSARGAL